jgi:peptidyl-prolyl cis-trans isomerase C
MTEQLSPLTSPRAYFDDHSEAVFVYHMMRVARERFQSGLSALSTRQLTEVTRNAEDSLELENLVLASPEALGVVIMPKHVGTALDELAAGYPDPETFVVDLDLNGLTIDSLALGLHREMVFEAVMQRVGARHIPVDAIDEQVYYEQHREDFTTPEQRTARHLLITVNSDDPEIRNAALERLDWLAGQMKGPPQRRAKRFANLALQHSECATADQGGRLGELARGQLDPRLDDVLFRLPEGAVGGPVETELGFHLIYCERIKHARTRPFSEARESIRALLIERRRRDCQASWIAKLRQPGH